MRVKTTCLKCGTNQMIDFGSLPLSEAIKAMDKIDVPGECPGGFHIELSGWKLLWQFGSALMLVYGDAAVKHPTVQIWQQREQEYRTERKLEYRPAPELLTDKAA